MNKELRENINGVIYDSNDGGDMCWVCDKHLANCDKHELEDELEDD